MTHVGIIRSALLAASALIASPAIARDHSAHGSHQPEPDPHAGHDMSGSNPTEPDEAPVDQPAVDHSAMDHAAMGHTPPAETEAEPAPMSHSQMDHAAMGHTMPPPANNSEPPVSAFEGPRHAADAVWGEAAMAPSREQLANENGNMRIGTIMIERLEARVGEGEDAFLWDVQGWYGGDIDKLWVKSEGEGEFGGTVEDAELQALWSHAIGPFFDLQTGIRYDFEPQSRAHLALGVQGLVPYMFEVDAAAFLSDKGDLTARIEAEYDQRITQRLILQPRAELELSAQNIPEIGIGAGLTSVEAGLRLRYEFTREFAPYIGVGFESALGDTADFARAAGDDPSRVVFLVGIRAWF